MGNLIVEATINTPYVNFDTQKGVIEIKGRSVPENPFDFYEPFLQWVEENFKETPTKITVNIQFEYFNSSSSSCILEIFKRLEIIKNIHENNEVIINWFYSEEDEDMLESGKDYEDIINLPFKMVKLTEIQK